MVVVVGIVVVVPPDVVVAGRGGCRGIVVVPVGVPGVPGLELGTFRPEAVLTCQVPPKVMSPSPVATRF